MGKRSKKKKRAAALRKPLPQQSKMKQGKKRKRPDGSTPENSGKRNKKQTLKQTQTEQQQRLSGMAPLPVGSKQLLEFVRENPSLSFLGNGKILCSVTGHECLPDLSLVKKHLASKRYKLDEGYLKDYSYLKPYIVDHDTNKRKLICLLTGHELNKIPEQIELHVQSKRFLRLQAEQKAKEERKKRKKALREALLKSRYNNTEDSTKASQVLGVDTFNSSDSDSSSLEDY